MENRIEKVQVHAQYIKCRSMNSTHCKYSATLCIVVMNYSSDLGLRPDRPPDSQTYPTDLKLKNQGTSRQSNVYLTQTC